MRVSQISLQSPIKKPWHEGLKVGCSLGIFMSNIHMEMENEVDITGMN